MVVVLLIRIIFFWGLIFFFLLLGKDAFSVKVNHRDIFVRNPVLKYDDEDKTLLLDIDEDKWSFFKLVGILKDDIKCTSDFKLWWTRVNDVGLKELAFDSDALELTNFALSNNNEVKFYFKKNNDRGVVATEGDVVALDDEDEGVSNKVVGVEAAIN